MTPMRYLPTIRRGVMVGVVVIGILTLPHHRENSHQAANAFVVPYSLRPTKSRSVKSRANHHHTILYTSQRPLQEILLELETKGIQFPPTATRSELEALLSRNNNGKRISRTKRENSSNVPYDSVQENWTSKNRNTNNVHTDAAEPRRRQSDHTYIPRRRPQRNTSSPEIADIVSEEGDLLKGRENQRRRRRQERRQLMQDRPRSSPSDTLFRVVDKASQKVARVVPEQVVNIGSKATRIASRKTRQLFNELVDLTYDDSMDGPRRSRPRPPSPASDQRRRRNNYPVNEEMDRVPPSRTRRKVQKRVWVNLETDEDFPTSKEKIVAKKDETINGPNTSSVPEEKNITPIREILSELDSLDIRFSAQATREELESLLERAKNSMKHRSPTATTGASSTRILTPLGKGTEGMDEISTTSTATKVSFSPEGPSEEGLWSRTSRVASKKVKTVPKKVSDTVRSKARTTYRKAKAGVSGLFQDQTPEEEDPNDSTTPIIVDAVVEDFSKASWNDDVIDVKAIYRESWSTTRQPRSEGQEYNHSVSARSRAAQDKLRTQRRRPRSGPGPNPDVESPRVEPFRNPKLERKSVNSADTLRLGPAKDTSRHTVDGSQPGKRRRNASGRKIYSPYQNNEDDDSSMYVDGLEQFGDFVANSVDSLLWGPEDDTGTKPPSTTSKSTSRSGKRRRSGHWKDRMEEQFDYMLGIHQDSEYYNRWVNQEREDDQNVEGTDAVSYAKRRIPEKPIWEEEDSLLSMLFGTDQQAKNRNDRFYSPSSFLGSGSLVKILQTLLRSSMLLAGGFARWASVRGSVPQPVVVVGVLSAVLSSRPGSRIRNAFLALLAIRAVGELVHGYVHDDADFWESRKDGQS